MVRSENIAIVGGGLSAVYAYFGALEAGYTPYQIDVLMKDKSPRLGAVFMYSSPIPWRMVEVDNSLWGTCMGYAYKQWKDADIQTSVNTRFRDGLDNPVVESLYDPENLYQALWNRIPIIKKIDFLSAGDMVTLSNQYKAVICTFPNEADRADYMDYIVRIPVSFREPAAPLLGYHVIYNGLLEVPWVRKTYMPGRIYTEYPCDFTEDLIAKFEEPRDGYQIPQISRVPDLKPNTPVLPPNRKICNNILRVGRMATFDRKYLSHYAQEDTKTFLETL